MVNAAVLPLEGRLETALGSGVFLAYYDPNLDITWLADANAGAGSAFDDGFSTTDGKMTWANANAWAAGLSIGGVSGWRLPSADVNEDGTVVDCDGGGVAGCEDTEMGFLYWEEGITDATPGPFSNVQSEDYWSGTEFDSVFAWSFDFDFGFQDESDKEFRDIYAWAVRSGDAPAVASALVDLTGTIKTPDGTDICAMVLASGQFMFSCNPPGVFSLTDLPRENDGSVKRQIYADGFLPKVDILTISTDEAVVMNRSGSCPTYNTPYDAGVFPDSAGKRIEISGSVLLQNTQTPICAMVLGNGQFMFSCDGSGSYALNIPLDNNGQFKLQVYADGFAPTIQRFDEFSATNDVRMARAVECQ